MSEMTLGNLFNKYFKKISYPYAFIGMVICMIVCEIFGVLMAPNYSLETLVVWVSSGAMIGVALSITWTVLQAFAMALREWLVYKAMLRTMRH
ncbi:hypothetical protein HN358_04455 [Candidatus Uhrbacteria bacterium]|nr:hypothetical protein [Candidatus Uhrbacteria bacterium]MBT7717035.1 hypothetical protein [Candidatus Uhrbacteria bacterium]